MPRNLHTWMWAEACEMLDQAERLHRQYFRLGATQAPTRCWEPPVDIMTTDQELRIVVALPGVAAEQVNVRTDVGVLIIEAVRPPPPRDLAIHRLEIPYGRFQRRVALPPGRYELREQIHNHGCLELRLIKH